MSRIVAAFAVTILTCALAGCTIAPEPTSPPPAPNESGVDGGGPAGRFPGCESVGEVLGALVDNLELDRVLSASQEAQEEYEQRVCVFVTDDAATQLGVTIAAIPFQQGELDSFAALPNAIPDARLEQHSAVLQTFATGDGDDGHLDSALYLFDTQYSVTIQGVGTSGSTSSALPGLSLPAAADAAFGVRELIR